MWTSPPRLAGRVGRGSELGFERDISPPAQSGRRFDQCAPPHKWGGECGEQHRLPAWRGGQGGDRDLGLNATSPLPHTAEDDLINVRLPTSGEVNAVNNIASPLGGEGREGSETWA